MIISIGEILVDMIGRPENGVLMFGRYAGGAPFNVACDIKKLNGKSGFVGCVGNDLMGDFLSDFVKRRNLDYTDVTLDSRYNTTLAFVALDEYGERKFSFYRKNTADYHLTEESLAKATKKADIVHLGTLMLSEESGRSFAKRVAETMKEARKTLSIDVNYREDIFASSEEAKKIYGEFIPLADVIKFSEEEIKIFSGKDDIESAVSCLARKDQLMLVTLGSKGSLAVWNGKTIKAESIPIKAVDTTGAGDAFYAGVLSRLDGKDLTKLAEEEIKEILAFGNICGALTATGYGAIDACPTLEDVRKFLN